jgi:hypothetical protein
VALVNSSPIIQTTSIPDPVAGSPYSTTIVVSDADSDPTTLAIFSGILPSGLSLSGPAKTVSGTPTTSGPYSVTLQATDGKGGVDSRTFSGNVVGNVSWSGSPLSSGAAGIPWSAVVPVATLAGGGTLSYSVHAPGTLPAGLSFSPSTRTLSGTPVAATAGSQTITLDATGSLGGSASASFPVTFAAASISWSDATLAAAIQGTSYSASLPAASFSAGGGTIAYAATSAVPFGLSLSSAGVLSGTPNSAGTSFFTAQATGSNGGTASATFTLTSSIPLLTGGKPQSACTSAGGTVVDAGGATICKFQTLAQDIATWGAAQDPPFPPNGIAGQKRIHGPSNYNDSSIASTLCPSGWTQYGRWTTTMADTCYNAVWGNCTTGYHAWASISPLGENCSGYGLSTCYSFITEIGCQ